MFPSARKRQSCKYTPAEPHRRSMFAVLPIGTAKAHRGNPAANIIAHSSYSLPVFFSGLASLVLSSSEVTLIDQHIKVTVQRLQKLCDKTPHCAVMFLGGQLPGKTLYHLSLWHDLQTSRLNSAQNCNLPAILSETFFWLLVSPSKGPVCQVHSPIATNSYRLPNDKTILQETGQV